MTMTQPPYLVGQFLLATPGMADPRFQRSTVAVCAHDEEGALGINLGELSDIRFHQILEQLDLDRGEVADRPVFVGGPCELQRGFVLHSLEFQLSDTLIVADRWGLSSSVDMLSSIARGKGPKRWEIALGYSGWGAGQLEGELTQNGWSVASGEPDWIFELPREDKWSGAWRSQGIDPGQLSTGFGSA